MTPEIVEAGGYTWRIVDERIMVSVGDHWIDWGHFDPRTGEPVRETSDPAPEAMRIDEVVSEALMMARRRALFRARR